MSEIATELTEPQRAALAKVACGCETAGSLTVLCGPSGVGKTIVLRRLAADGEMAATPAGSSGAVRDVPAWLAHPDDLPPVVLADDAHAASELDLSALVARCRGQRAAAALVLAGQGRLFTLLARDRRLTEATQLRVALLPGSPADTRSVLERHSRELDGPAWDEAVVERIHEIAAGIPAACRRLAELACIVAASRPDGCILPGDIEKIHRRLSPDAA